MAHEFCGTHFLHTSHFPPLSLSLSPLFPSLTSYFPPSLPLLPQVYSSYTDNKDRLAEVVYEWYGSMRTVTWADVAGTCRKIGYYDLADSLEKAYDTGGLHTCSLLLCEVYRNHNQLCYLLYLLLVLSKCTYSSLQLSLLPFCRSPSLP